MKKRFTFHLTLLSCLLFMLIVGCGKKGENKDKVAEGPPKTGTDTTQTDAPKKIIGKDGAEMVLIPAGEFEMGTAESEIDGLVRDFADIDVEHSWFGDEVPRHTVYLDAFYMDVYEVTNAQYKKFMDATGHPAPAYWNAPSHNQPNQPVVGVSWHDAAVYAQWAGKRLPTEAEWEKAARGGLVGKRYPWGDEAPNGTQCNFADRNSNYNWSDMNADDGYQYTAPVGKYPPNGYGTYDMAGNAWEWCMDEYDSGFYAKSPKNNPVAVGVINTDVETNVETFRSFRGGSWGFGPIGVRVAGRYNYGPTNTFNALGFRCAGNVTP